MRNFLQSLIVGVVVALFLTGSATAQSACQTNADTAAMHIQMANNIVTLTDSATLVNQGLWYKPTGGITLVTDSRICGKAVTAINSTMPVGDPRRITKAYVLKIGNKGYAAVGEHGTSLYHLFDTKFKWLAGMGALD